MAQIRTLLTRAVAHPVPSGTRLPLDGRLASYAIKGALYGTSGWPRLTQALQTALDGDAGPMLDLADEYLARSSEGHYESNLWAGHTATQCDDGGGDHSIAGMRAQASRIAHEAPTLGPFFSYTGVQCAQWPVPATPPPASYASAGAPPILVVATTGDPATPYASAVRMAAMLPSAELLTRVGHGHAALGLSTCIDTAVDAYLLDGTMPAPSTRCTT